MFKKTFFLLMCLLWLLLSPTSGQQYDENNDPDELLNKAKYCYSEINDYPRALQFLDRVIEIAGSPHLRAEALMRKAYVHFLMKKDVREYDAMIRQALKYDAQIVVDKYGYKRKYAEIVAMIRNTPETSANAVQTEVFRRDPLTIGPCGRFFLSANVYSQQIQDDYYKEIYSGSALVPQIRAGVQLIRNFYLVAGYGAFSADGVLEELNEPVHMKQNIFMAGFRYNKRITRRLAWKVDVLAVTFNYKETGLNTEVTKSTIGYGLEGGLTFELANFLFTEISAGIIYGSDINVDRKIYTGGLRVGAGLGFRL